MQRLRIAVGMSGGVDSAVSAWLLKKKGFDVVGVYMNNWDRIEEDGFNCPRTKDEADARYVCEKLRIPFTTVSFVKEYWDEIFLKVLENYRRGRTVVPDVMCNKEIKFERLHSHATGKLGADLIATGHYARSSHGDSQEFQYMDSGVKLLCSVDPLKDQTPFLCTLQQNHLRRAMFPVGSMTKTQVRQIAREQGLANIANKPESMGICFVGKRKDFDSFIDQYIEPRPGKILSLDGKLLGRHDGIHHFTLGKRIGIQGSHLGYFVAKIDVEKDIVYAMCVFYRGVECLGGGEVQHIISTLSST